MKKFFYSLVLGLLVLSLSSFASDDSVEIVLSSDGIDMPAYIEVKQTQAGNIPAIKSKSVIYKNFHQKYFVSAQGVSVDINAPIDNDIGARLMLILSNTNARLIYYHDELGNVGASIDSMIVEDNGSKLIFLKEDVEKAFGEIYNKMIPNALAKSLNVDELPLCAQMKVESDLVCEAQEERPNVDCSMGAFSYTLTTSCENAI